MKYFFTPISLLVALSGCVSIPGAAPTASAPPSPPAPPASSVAVEETSDLILEVQDLLNKKGYSAGAADGKAGPVTRAAIRNYEKDKGLPIDGLIDNALYASLKQSTDEPAVAATDRNTPVAEDRETTQKRELARNHPVVVMRGKCDGLFVPFVGKSKFRNVLSVFSMKMLNTSDLRYEVKYDVTFQQHRRTYFENVLSDIAVEKSVIVRANQYIEVLLEKEFPSAGVTIRDVKRIEILECKRS